MYIWWFCHMFIMYVGVSVVRDDIDRLIDVYYMIWRPNIVVFVDTVVFWVCDERYSWWFFVILNTKVIVKRNILIYWQFRSYK